MPSRDSRRQGQRHAGSYPLWIARARTSQPVLSEVYPEALEGKGTSQPVLSEVELALASREIEGESGGCEAQGY